MASEKKNDIDLQSLAEKSYSEAVEYVSGLDDTCPYTHGYLCQDEEKGALTGQNTIPGVQLQAWSAAYEIFLSQDDMLTEEQKSLKHYRISFDYSDESITIMFLPLLLPQMIDGKPEGLMRATFGQEVRITLDASEFKLEKVIFGR